MFRIMYTKHSQGSHLLACVDTGSPASDRGKDFNAVQGNQFLISLLLIMVPG